MVGMPNDAVRYIEDGGDREHGLVIPIVSHDEARETVTLTMEAFRKEEIPAGHLPVVETGSIRRWDPAVDRLWS
jgi:hypothetical protein